MKADFINKDFEIFLLSDVTVHVKPLQFYAGLCVKRREIIPIFHRIPNGR